MKEQVLIVGAAKSGIAVAKLLLRHGFAVTITDMGEIKEKKDLEIQGMVVFDQGHPRSLFHIQWKFIVKNPGIPYTVAFIQHFVEQKVKIYTEIEIASWYAKKFRYAAVTGTNGKTTITTLLYEMLKHNGKALVAGNIGYPLSEIALEFEEEEKDIALELSNFQLLGIESFAPTVSTICNLAPDHLDYMKSLDTYYASKMKIYEYCTKDDWFIRNIDDENIIKYAKHIPCTCIDISLQHTNADVYRENGKIMLHEQYLFLEEDLKIPGNFNLMNASMAAVMAYRMGISVTHIRKTIQQFHGIAHRMEYIGEYQGIRFYNDSKATNPHALSAALQAFPQKVILLAGGYEKHISFEELKQFEEKIKYCFAFGQTKEKFMDIFQHVKLCEDMKIAFQQALVFAEKGDIILLSPACSSYDQFKTFEERGNIFKQMVQTYMQKGDIT